MATFQFFETKKDVIQKKVTQIQVMMTSMGMKRKKLKLQLQQDDAMKIT
jgi:hypothetical protein